MYVRWLRGYVGHQPLIAVGVTGVIQDEAGRVLLQHRTDFRQWGLPGGSMDLGETVLDALRRELREEMDVAVGDARPFAIYSGPHTTITYPNGDVLQVTDIVFHVLDWTGVPRPDGVETDEARFFALDDLPPVDDILRFDLRSLDGFRAYLAGEPFIVD